jgi:hypothetical protein
MMGYRLLIVLVSAGVAAGCDPAAEGVFGVTPGGAVSSTTLSFIVQPSTLRPATVMTPPVRVAIQNSTGATIPTASNNVTVTITPGTGTAGAVLSGTLTVTAVNGIAVFPNLIVDRSGAGYTLTASAPNVVNARSAPFNVNP